MPQKFKALMLVALIAPSLALSADDLADKYFSGQNPTLTVQEKAALAVAKKWEASSSAGVTPVAGAGGVIRFPFGGQIPSLICAVMQVCDVALQAGEQVNSVQLGDTARWTVDPAISGGAGGETIHLIIKPLDVGLETSLVVTTSRRTYHFKLRSHRTEYMAQVGFMYPEDALAKFEMVRVREQQVRQERQERTIPRSGEYLGDLSFEYDVDGSVPWKPVRVFNDGRKTIIEMPKTLSQGDAPTLLVVRRDGGLFRDEETVMVNYRVQSERYIVDSVFDKAILISGVGSQQDRVTITRRK